MPRMDTLTLAVSKLAFPKKTAKRNPCVCANNVALFTRLVYECNLKSHTRDITISIACPIFECRLFIYYPYDRKSDYVFVIRVE